MRTLTFYKLPSRNFCGALIFGLVCLLGSACSSAETPSKANSDLPSANTANSAPPINAANEAPKGATIPIDPNGPADTVRVFYKLLREKKFKEAIFLTNLRPAVEGLTDNELKDFSLDFAALAGQIPAEIEINGEIITGDTATVTALLPSEDSDNKEIQKLQLRKDGDVWVLQTVDPDAQAKIKKEGKNYFYQLRIEVHEGEAKKMLERISKAELANSLQNEGLFADLPTLVSAGLLPEDIQTSGSTGYVYAINITSDKKQFSATATPAEYGKSGKLSFLLLPDAKGISHVSSKDTGGKPMHK